MRVLLYLISLVFAVQAHAITPKYIITGENDFNIGFGDSRLAQILKLGLELNSDYQIGAEWGKKIVTEEDLNSDVHFRRMAMSTAKIRSGGTGFYLGEFNGKYVVATNHHVCESEADCSGATGVKFPWFNIAVGIDEFYGSWSDVDLALFSVKLNAEQAKALNAVASPFAFYKDLYHGEPLVTIGFGVANNPNRVMVANRDSDCRVYSGDKEYRFMGDPDDFNPAPYKAWSFSNGCDVSHGDSGSAMMDRETGEVVGIIWTGRIPKDPKVQNAEYMNGLLAKPNEDVWKQLSYGVPAVQMRSFLEELISTGKLPKEHAETLSAVLSGGK